MRSALFVVGALAVVAASACGGAPQSGSAPPTGPPSTVVVGGGPTCPPPSPGPTPIAAFLDYPPSGSIDVSVSISELIEKGADTSGGGLSIVVTSPSGNVPLGTPTIAPSPYPTPFATPPPTFGMMAPYIAVPLPTLASSTVYTVSDVYTDWANNPPVCSAQYTQYVGTFSTGP